MKRIILSAFVIISLLLSGCGNKQEPQQQQAVVQKNEPTAEQMKQKGEYLVTICGCHDCHSPKKMGDHGPEILKERMLSGHPADEAFQKFDRSIIGKGMVLFNSSLTASAGPWGISYSANLTSDQTGIGNWTEENFMRALKQGKFKGLENSRTLLPPMPWQNFTGMDDEEVKAIFAFLKSTSPVSNVPPAPVPPDKMQ